MYNCTHIPALESVPGNVRFQATQILLENFLGKLMIAKSLKKIRPCIGLYDGQATAGNRVSSASQPAHPQTTDNPFRLPSQQIPCLHALNVV